MNDATIDTNLTPKRKKNMRVRIIAITLSAVAAFSAAGLVIGSSAYPEDTETSFLPSFWNPYPLAFLFRTVLIGLFIAFSSAERNVRAWFMIAGAIYALFFSYFRAHRRTA